MLLTLLKFVGSCSLHYEGYYVTESLTSFNTRRLYYIHLIFADSARYLDNSRAHSFFVHVILSVTFIPHCCTSFSVPHCLGDDGKNKPVKGILWYNIHPGVSIALTTIFAIIL